MGIHSQKKNIKSMKKVKKVQERKNICETAIY